MLVLISVIGVAATFLSAQFVEKSGHYIIAAIAVGYGIFTPLYPISYIPIWAKYFLIYYAIL
jgi:hypothetical protein